MLLQIPIDPEKVLDRGFNISPDTVLGFLIVTLLCVIIILGTVVFFLWKQLNAERSRITTSDERIISTIHSESKDLLGQIKEFITLKFHN